ncbi:MAG: glycosyl transferase [Gammaproteobacteria bacterium]|nr:glycosyl transferase [Gammaproteobacteria bacterium]|tara:strand:- start:2122 stop:3159 length:1038 start_codon:yes stop_codon:yes gene_type:complete
MDTIDNFLLLASISLLSFLLTFLLKEYLLSKKLLVKPDLRSSHKDPKPQGGGLAVILSLCISLTFFLFSNLIEKEEFLFFLIPGLIVAFVSFIDDFSEVRPLIRIVVHFFCALLGLFLVGGFNSIDLFGTNIDLGLWGYLIGSIYIVWFINLYNFMDGIDGLASIQAIFVFLVFSVFAYFILSDLSLTFILISISASVFGFLFFNFPKSVIFLGDVGSSFLGILIALISIKTSQINPELFWSWLILLGIFLVDSTYTLVIRVLRKEKFYLPHSLHAYQKLSRLFDSHSKTTLVLLAINLLWLLPIASLVGLKITDGLSSLLLAYLPILFLVYYLRAGMPDKKSKT